MYLICEPVPQDQIFYFEGKAYYSPRYTFDGPSLLIKPNNDKGLCRKVTIIEGKTYAPLCTLGDALLAKVAIPHDCLTLYME